MNNIKKIQHKTYTFCSSHVPVQFEGVRIVFLSDIHHGSSFPRENLRGLINMTNNLDPDIILLGGDYVIHSPARIKPFFEEASRLRAPLGVYGVLGNHDRWTDAPLTIECMIRAGITFLDNKAVWIKKGGARIRLGGVGDLSTTTQDIGPTLAGTKKDDLTILLTHHPDYARYMPRGKIDLMLCGHTHGGQIGFISKCVPDRLESVRNRFLSGILKKDSTTLIVTNGIGTVGPPIRIGAAPQIWDIALSHNKVEASMHVPVYSSSVDGRSGFSGVA